MTIELGLLIISIIIFIYATTRLKDAKALKNQYKHQTQVQEEKLRALKKEIKEAQTTYLFKRNQVDKVEDIIRTTKKELHDIEREIQQTKSNINKQYDIQSKIVQQRLDDFKRISKQAAEHYVDVLQEDYKAAEAAHKKGIAQLQEEYNNTAAALTTIKNTRKAAYEALLKEKEIKQNKDNYRLNPDERDLQDIHMLEDLKLRFSKPRTLSMLIWQTYWQPLAKQKFPVILQSKTKTGIYKITNIETDECYIGQSVDIYKRWCQHCKAGLGIDTPAKNLLYKAIKTYGLESFTFQILCECPKQELDDKERYFIELYQSDTFGYNSTAGNK